MLSKRSQIIDEHVMLYLCCIFHQVADSLEKGTEHEDEYMISENELLVNRLHALCIYLTFMFSWLMLTNLFGSYLKDLFPYPRTWGPSIVGHLLLELLRCV